MGQQMEQSDTSAGETGRDAPGNTPGLRQDDSRRAASRERSASPARRWANAFAALIAGSVAAVTLVACVSTGGSGGGRLSQLPAVPSPADNPTTPEKVALGKQLFFDPRLSGSGQNNCESCHYRDLGWTDGLPLSRRDDGALNTRHSPTLYNVGYLTSWYWDGRATTLEAQILAAWRNQMSGDPDKVAARLAQIPAYVAQFQQVFGSAPSSDAIVKSLAAYLRTKNSGDSTWDRHEKGEPNVVTADAIAGFNLFMGKARCAICHTPPLYSDSGFHNIGLEAGKPKPDPGRFAVTKQAQDMSAFKTPTLRSVAISGPYFHDGSGASLEAAVRYMASGGGKDPNKSPLLIDTGLSDREVQQVVAFLRTLTSHEPLVRPTIP
jgi:cytochrome c peroxidase